VNIKRVATLAKKTGVAWLDDFAPSMGAAISYYTVFSLAPLLVIVIAIAGALFGREAVTGQITGQLGSWAVSSAARAPASCRTWWPARATPSGVWWRVRSA